jgi:hypothetical protein
LGFVQAKEEDDLNFIFIGVFVAVCAVAVFFVFKSKAEQDNRKKALLSSDRNLVEVTFDYHATPASKLSIFGNPGETSYVLHSENGKEPEVIGESIIVPAGSLALDIEFFQKVTGRNFADSLTRKSAIFTLVAGKEYQIAYDYMESKFDCNAEG